MASNIHYYPYDIIMVKWTSFFLDSKRAQNPFFGHCTACQKNKVAPICNLLTMHLYKKNPWILCSFENRFYLKIEEKTEVQNNEPIIWDKIKLNDRFKKDYAIKKIWFLI